MVIKVCVGSSCHLKGSYDVIEAFKEILKKYDVEDLVNLQASFCLGYCAQGVTVKCDELSESQSAASTVTPIDGGIFLHSVSAENAEEVFVRDVYPLIHK